MSIVYSEMRKENILHCTIQLFLENLIRNESKENMVDPKVR